MFLRRVPRCAAWHPWSRPGAPTLRYQGIADLLAAAVLAIGALVTRGAANELSFFDGLHNNTHVGNIVTLLLWVLAAAAAVRGAALLVGARGRLTRVATARRPGTDVRFLLGATLRVSRGCIRGRSSNLPDVDGGHRKRGSAHDHGRLPHEEVRQLHRRRRRHLHRRGGPGDRLPRPQRRGQVHDHARHGRADSPHVWRRTHLRPPVLRPAQPRPRGGRPARRLGPARRSHRAGDPHHRRAAPWACPGCGSRRCSTGSASPRRRPTAGCATTRSACASGSASRHALIGDPSVLILDEPANGLDPAGIRWMRDLLAVVRRPGRHRAALLAPAARDRGHRRRHRRDRQRQHRRAGHQERPAGGRRDRRTQRGAEHPGARPRAGRHRQHARARRRRTHPGGRRAGRARSPWPPASPSPSSAPPTARAWRRCSSSSPPRHNEKEQRHEHHDRGTRPSEKAPARRPPRSPRPGSSAVELRKMFDTRSGFWLMTSVAITGAPGHRRGDPVGARQRADLRHLRGGDRVPDVGDPADGRDPVGHQRVDPAQWPDARSRSSRTAAG